MSGAQERPPDDQPDAPRWPGQWPAPPPPGPPPGQNVGPRPGPPPGQNVGTPPTEQRGHQPPGWASGPDQQVGIGPNTRCYEHPDRLAGAICRSCNRPICADCMVQAPVGWHCRRCVHKNARTSPVTRYRPSNAGLPGFWETPVTLSLIAVNVVVYIVTSATPRFQFDLEEIGLLIYQGQWYRLISSAFVHYSIEHIGLNMLSLLIIGRLVEPVLGRWRYLALYLVSGFGGAVSVYLFTNPFTQSGGASGAIFGLFGAYFILARRASANTSGILVLIGVNLAYSFAVPGISWQAHVGGLVIGMVVAYAFSLVRRQRRNVMTLLNASSLVVMTAVLAVLVVIFLPGQFS